MYDKRDIFDFKIVSFQFLKVLRLSLHHIESKLIRFARASSHVVDFNIPNKSLTQELLKQGY